MIMKISYFSQTFDIPFVRTEEGVCLRVDEEFMP